MIKHYVEPSISLEILKIGDLLTASGNFTEGTESDSFTGNPWGE